MKILIYIKIVSLSMMLCIFVLESIEQIKEYITCIINIKKKIVKNIMSL